jgi:hypothetical protein
MKMNDVIVLAVLIAAVLSLPLPAQEQGDVPEAPSPRALEAIDGRQAMALANAWGARVQSEVTTRGVSFLFPDGFRRLVALPPGQVLIAVAPYREETHPCETHTMSSCQGELVGVPIEVLAQASDGTVLIQETMTTLANGFIELWLPQDLEVRLILRAGSLAAEELLSTADGSKTCVTTMRLQ